MEHMNNVVIDRAERGKSGEASWGTWQAWSIYFVGMEPKFDYFERDGVIPFPGMHVATAEYVVEQSGQYTNYKLKKMVPAKLTDATGGVVPVSPVMHMAKPIPLSPTGSGAKDFEAAKRLTMCTSYAKDIMVQLLANSSYVNKSFSEIIDLVGKGGRRLAEKIGEITEIKPEKAVSVALPQPAAPADSVATASPPSVGSEILKPDKTVTPGLVGQVTQVPKIVSESVPTPDDNIPF